MSLIFWKGTESLLVCLCFHSQRTWDVFTGIAISAVVVISGLSVIISVLVMYYIINKVIGFWVSHDMFVKPLIFFSLITVFKINWRRKIRVPQTKIDPSMSRPHYTRGILKVNFTSSVGPTVTKTLFEPKEFESSGFAFRKHYKKVSISKTTRLLQSWYSPARVLLKHKFKMTSECCISNFFGIVFSELNLHFQNSSGVVLTLNLTK